MNLNEYFESYRAKPCEKHLSEVLLASQSLVYGIVLKVTKNEHDAEDLTQEVLIKVIQNINLFPLNVNFGGWLNQVSLHAAINHYQQKKRIKSAVPKLQEIDKKKSSENKDETIAIIYQHLAALESNDGSLIINKYIHALTYDQMSQLYKQPRSTIELKINNILKKLKASIEKAGFAGVALALASTLDQLKATEVSFDLLPKIKEHFPSTYPKVKSEFVSTKVLLKVMVPIVAVLIAYFTIDHLNSSNQTSDMPSSELAKAEKPNKTNNRKNAEIEINKLNQVNTQNKNADLELIADAKETINNFNKTSIAKEEPKAVLENDFAGQLIDIETKKPIADAKLEIWDIYTYEKIETTTDAEGKYFIPKGLETTFFFFLKFLKEGYAVKQTFQHFEIHKKILIEMNIGKKINCKLDFKKPVSGELYFGSQCNLGKEIYLSNNQKLILTKIFEKMISTAPLEFFTFEKIKIENASVFFIDKIFELPVDKFKDFVIWCNGPKNKSLKYIEGNTCWLDLTEYSNIIISSIATGKLITNKEMKVFNQSKNENFFLMSNSLGEVPINSPEFFKQSVVTISEEEYFADFGNRSAEPNPFSSAIFSQSSDGGVTNTVSMTLFPFVTIVYEPLSLNSEYHNSQALFAGQVFSRKSLLRKTDCNTGKLKVYDQYFEKLLLSNNMKTSLGGIIDINAELNTFEDKEIKINIMLNNALLKNIPIKVYLEDQDLHTFESSEEITINESGNGFIKIPIQEKQLLIEFSVKNIFYSKLVNLSQISNDIVLLNFNKKLVLQINPSITTSNILANKMERYLRADRIAENDNFHKRLIKKKISNANTQINFSDTEENIFVEEGVDYTLTDNHGCGIKTNFNHLIAVNLFVHSNIDQIEIKSVTDQDYTTFQLNISNANEMEDLNWQIEVRQSNIFREDHRGIFEFEKVASFKPSEFYKEFTVGEDAIKNKTILLLKNRRYFLSVSAKGFSSYNEVFSTSENNQINKTIVLNKRDQSKSNAIQFVSGAEDEVYGITKLIKSDDIIYEYNGVIIKNVGDMIKAQKECNLEKVTIKLIRNKMPVSLMIPAYRILGLKNYYLNEDSIPNH